MYRLILDKNFGDSIHFYSLQFYNFLLLCFFSVKTILWKKVLQVTLPSHLFKYDLIKNEFHFI